MSAETYPLGSLGNNRTDLPIMFPILQLPPISEARLIQDIDDYLEQPLTAERAAYPVLHTHTQIDTQTQTQTHTQIDTDASTDSIDYDMQATKAVAIGEDDPFAPHEGDLAEGFMGIVAGWE